MTQTWPTSVGKAASARGPNRTKSHRQVGQWELVEFAAIGSLAQIYRARPAGTSSDRLATYAVKMLLGKWQDDPHAIWLLQREALVGQSVSHPHLVPILSATVLEPPRLLVMPWLEGASLRARLAAGEEFDVPTALWIARQTAEALDALYAAGWMHGDISTGNIHVSSAGHVTLLDLSFARRADETGSAVDRPIMGTASYLAPEYFTSALRADIRSDIYSLGAVLFELLSGRVPFLGQDLTELASQHRQTAAPVLSKLAPHVPDEVVHLVRRMMAKQPLRRPQSPRDLIGRLANLEIATFSHRLAGCGAS